MAPSTLPSPGQNIRPYCYLRESSIAMIEEMRSACVARDLPRFQVLFNSWLADTSCSNIYELSMVMMDAVEHDRPEIVSELLRCGMTLHFSFALRAISRKSKDILSIFLQNGWDINEPISETEPPVLGYAIKDREMTIWLLDHGADPNSSCSIDLTPMSYAVECASVDIIELLFDQGADVHKGQLLHHAIKRETDIIDVVAILLRKGASINAKMYQDHYFSWRLYYFMGLGTPLHKAAESGRIDVIRYLISQGADVNIKDSMGQTALDRAAKRGHSHVVDLLRSEIEK